MKQKNNVEYTMEIFNNFILGDYDSKTSTKKEIIQWAADLLKKSNITSVIGDWGMGKSTFSKNLSKVTLQKIFHLEKEKYISSGVQRSIPEFIEIYYNALKIGNYIFDGNSYSKNDKVDDFDFIMERLDKSDVIVFFDGDPIKVKSDYINRTKRVEAGEEERVEGSWNFVANKEVAIDGYFKRKEILRPKLEIFRNKIMKIRNHKHINTIIDLFNDNKNNT